MSYSICNHHSKSSYLIKGKRAHTIRSQLHGVQHCHLNHPISLCASARPILVTLHLQIHSSCKLCIIINVQRNLLQTFDDLRVSSIRFYTVKWGRFCFKKKRRIWFVKKKIEGRKIDVNWCRLLLFILQILFKGVHPQYSSSNDNLANRGKLPLIYT